MWCGVIVRLYGREAEEEAARERGDGGPRVWTRRLPRPPSHAGPHAVGADSR